MCVNVCASYSFAILIRNACRGRRLFGAGGGGGDGGLLPLAFYLLQNRNCIDEATNNIRRFSSLFLCVLENEEKCQIIEKDIQRDTAKHKMRC